MKLKGKKKGIYILQNKNEKLFYICWEKVNELYMLGKSRCRDKFLVSKPKVQRDAGPVSPIQ